MSQREKLIEDLEEALFAVIVNDYMEADGARLLERSRRLKAQPDVTVSEQADEKCLRLIGKVHRKERHRKYRRSAYKLASKVALVACCLALLFTTAFAVSPTLQERTVNLIIRTFDVSTDFEFYDPLDPQYVQPETSFGQYDFTFIPDGFVWVDGESSDTYFWRRYENRNGDMIHIEASIGMGDFSVDTQGAQMTESVAFGGLEGVYAEKDGLCSYHLGDTEHLGFVSVTGSGVDREELDSIVKGISYQE